MNIHKLLLRTTVSAVQLCLMIVLPFISGTDAKAQDIYSIEKMFLNPPQDSKPIIIWQWMDGLVTKESITADLEAFKEAGLGGVQNFQIGSAEQGLIGNPDVLVGNQEWKELMRWAMQECARLGLSFGTHNCPGWSSSASPNVLPEDSMQKLVWTETPARGISVILPQPETNLGWYRDIAVLAVPASGIIPSSAIIDLSGKMEASGYLSLESLPEGDWAILRFGHTTNMKTNGSTAPESGAGLECDKFSRKAIRKFWNGYPKMVIDLAGEYAGTTFKRFEIDSYEAGPQDWTELMPEEFHSRRGYDLIPWLAVLAGRTVGSGDATADFLRDWDETLTDLFAEIYYSEINGLVKQIPGMQLVIEPYHGPIDTDKICKLLGDALWCCEFWTRPADWGDGSSDKMSRMVRKYGHRQLYAEGFTCWPLSAWQDDPAVLKVVADHQFSLGVNSMTLHAYGSNPWTWMKPGMNFGKWGTQFTPYQTWWEAGGAKEFFTYMSRCASILRNSDVVCDMHDSTATLHILSSESAVEWLHKRTDDRSDVFFVTNTKDCPDKVELNLAVSGRLPEIWDAKYARISDCVEWSSDGHSTEIHLSLEPHGSAFVVFRHPSELMKAPAHKGKAEIDALVLPQNWKISFPDGWGAPESIDIDRLASWSDSGINGVKYFSGTATYRQEITVPRRFLKGKRNYFILDLGEVKNLARVKVNGRYAGEVLWTPPFSTEIGSLLKPGRNVIEIEVTNLWPNRMIGDEEEPDDVVWAEPSRYSYAPGNPIASAFMKEIPTWLINREPRPSSGRYTVSSFKFFGKGHSLFPSGLLGPEIVIRKIGQADKH